MTVKCWQCLFQNTVSSTGQPLCLYGDPAYPLRVHLQGPFKGAALTPQQEAFNVSMSKVRVSVEWVFGDILYMYVICALLRNAHSCVYGSTTSTFFGIEPPSLDSYFV